MEKTVSNTGTGAKAKRFGTVDYIKITIFGFALAALWSSFHSIVLPVRLLDFVAESQKNTYLGLLTFAGLLLAMAVQPIVGAISDRSGFRWGRRRPFILFGTIGAFLLLPGIGFVGSFAVIFAIYCLLQISCNTAQGPYQAFIPDLVPGERRGLASGVKSLLEVAGGLALVWVVGHFMGRYFAGEGSSWLWLTLGTLAILLLGAMIFTVLTVKEQPGGGGSQLPLLATLYKSFKIDVKASPNFILFLVSRLLILMPMIVFQAFGLYYLKDVVGVANPPQAMANLLIVAGGCMLAVVYPAGRLSDRVGRQPIGIFAGVLGALGVVVLFFSHSYPSLMLVGGGLLGISYGTFVSSNWALATDILPMGEEARYLGLTNLATAGASALARLVGPVIDFFNAYSPRLGYDVMLLICFVFYIVGSVVLRRIKVRA